MKMNRDRLSDRGAHIRMVEDSGYRDEMQGHIRRAIAGPKPRGSLTSRERRAKLDRVFLRLGVILWVLFVALVVRQVLA